VTDNEHETENRRSFPTDFLCSQLLYVNAQPILAKHGKSDNQLSGIRRDKRVSFASDMGKMGKEGSGRSENGIDPVLFL
jgi:hypothetical protein